MRSWLIGVVAVGMFAALLAVWRSRAPVYAPYMLVDPDALFAGVPGAPKRVRDVDGAAVGGLGYVAAADMRIAAALSSLRPGDPGDPYDVDLALRVIVYPSLERSREAFAKERAGDERLMRQRYVALALPKAIQADEAVGWASQSGRPGAVVQARYGNYLVRYTGLITPGGYFPSLPAFIEAFGASDRHFRRTLQESS